MMPTQAERQRISGAEFKTTLRLVRLNPVLLKVSSCSRLLPVQGPAQGNLTHQMVAPVSICSRLVDVAADSGSGKAFGNHHDEQ